MIPSVQPVSQNGGARIELQAPRQQTEIQGGLQSPLGEGRYLAFVIPTTREGQYISQNKRYQSYKGAANIMPMSIPSPVPDLEDLQTLPAEQQDMMFEQFRVAGTNRSTEGIHRAISYWSMMALAFSKSPLAYWHVQAIPDQRPVETIQEAAARYDQYMAASSARQGEKTTPSLPILYDETDW